MSQEAWDARGRSRAPGTPKAPKSPREADTHQTPEAWQPLPLGDLDSPPYPNYILIFNLKFLKYMIREEVTHSNTLEILNSIDNVYALFCMYLVHFFFKLPTNPNTHIMKRQAMLTRPLQNPTPAEITSAAFKSPRFCTTWCTVLGVIPWRHHLWRLSGEMTD